MITNDAPLQAPRRRQEFLCARSSGKAAQSAGAPLTRIHYEPAERPAGASAFAPLNFDWPSKRLLRRRRLNRRRRRRPSSADSCFAHEKRPLGPQRAGLHPLRQLGLRDRFQWQRRRRHRQQTTMAESDMLFLVMLPLQVAPPFGIQITGEIWEFAPLWPSNRFAGASLPLAAVAGRLGRLGRPASQVGGSPGIEMRDGAQRERERRVEARLRSGPNATARGRHLKGAYFVCF